MEQQSKELPFRVSQQQQSRQPQQQYWFPSCLRGPSTLLCQSWQVGICRACQGRVQTCSGDAPASKKKTELGGLVGNCSNRCLAHDSDIQVPAMPQGNLRAVIFTALSLEYEAVAVFLADRQEVLVRGTIYEKGEFTGSNLIWNIGIAQIGASNSNAAIEVERAIEYFEPHVILFIGVARGIKDVEIGDVVVAAKVYGYEINAIRDDLIQYPDIWLGFYGLGQYAGVEAKKSDWLKRLASVPSPAPKVYLAPIVLSNTVVTSEFFQGDYEDALAVEIYNFGLFRIVQKLQRSVSTLVIRGISNHIDNRSEQWSNGEQIWQEQAAQHATAFAFQLLASYETLGISRSTHRSQCFTEPAIQLDLMLIPTGTFMMGSPPDELGRWDDEGPQYEVTVATFLIGRYPVTQAQWRAIATRTDLKVKHDLEPDPSEFEGDDHPVESVSWYEAVEFCNRLSRLTQHTYRLPTEAEWEYACRAGTTTPFHFGETITTDLANYCGEDDEDGPEEYPGHYGKGPKGEYRQATTPVTHFHPLANAFGLCDMHGNVWEWCLDHWHGNYEGAPADGSPWLTEDDESSRVYRGGSWSVVPRTCRSACRSDDNPGDRLVNVGFRVVCEV